MLFTLKVIYPVNLLISRIKIANLLFKNKKNYSKNNKTISNDSTSYDGSY